MANLDELDNELKQLEVQLDEDKPDTPSLPDKYRGKSLEDIVRMHQEAEKLIGKQATEVGEIRRLADSLIKQQLSSSAGTKKPQPVEEETIDEVDFFANPKEALNKWVDRHPAVKQSQEMLQKLTREDALKRLRSAHPDYTNIVADESFKQWVNKSKIRVDLFNRAHSNYDFDSANELFETWKELKGKVKEQEEAVKEESKVNLNAAKVGSTGSQAKAGGKEFFSRRALLELMKTDPKKYEALEPRIRKAYEEGRVRD